MNPFKNLQDQDKEFHIVEHWKWYFAISGAILLIALILLCTIGMKIGIDFAGGYSISVQYSDSVQLERSTYEELYYNDLRKIVEELKDETGKPYNIVINHHQLQGTSSILMRFKRLPGFNMEDAIEGIQTQLQAAIQPLDGNPYTVQAKKGNSVSGTVSGELIINAVASVILAIALMMIYVMFRFEFISGLATSICLLHNVLMMFAFMIFARFELSGTFIAAMITVIGYSINNTIIIFDRLRADRKENPKMPKVKLVNSALKATLMRTFNTTVTTLFTLVILTILGVDAIREFALPIIVGLVMGAYSSYFIAPSIWVLLTVRSDKKKAAKDPRAARKKSRTEPAKIDKIQV
ncbi:MAG: protein translocase subunit SecF [Firmicutes bacterium]|nr:protein translocase subunit SecF [Bacillota bacterium]